MLKLTQNSFSDLNSTFSFCLQSTEIFFQLKPEVNTLTELVLCSSSPCQGIVILLCCRPTDDKKSIKCAVVNDYTLGLKRHRNL